MNLLVTGGCGFIGSNFINYYYKKNPNVKIVNIDAMYYCSNINNILPEIQNDIERYKFIHGNIQCKDLIKYILKENNITHVIHFAAQTHVDNSFELSLQYTHDNILGTHILLEMCRQWNKLKLFIHISTDEVYGESMLDTNIQHCEEESVLCPTNPYAATKAGAELIAMSYYHSFKMPIIITRGNNVYGINQYPEKLIPKFIELLYKDIKVPIQGEGDSIRNFLYIDDVVNAFDIILNKGKIGEIYNIGGENEHEYSVLDIAKLLIKLIKNTDDYENWIEYIIDRPFNDKRYYLTNSKLRNLGWNITWTVQNGIKYILENKKK